ncbi:Uncharacterised protein [uncultured archaeon]|nr:Uncharacterised protein [uncultured archaeon]
MNRAIIVLIIIFVLFSGCVASNQNTPDIVGTNLTETPKIVETPHIQTSPDAKNESFPAQTTVNQSPLKRSDLLIDRISLDMTNFSDRKWSDLYQADELDCSRMSTYFWGYLRSNYHVAPKIIVSYQRQHAWLALKVSDVGNSSKYRHWNLKGIDYYYLEATIPKVVVDDNERFLINGQPYTSAEFYDATIYVFDSPSDANDFHADYSVLGGFNQEFVLKKDDLDKIQKFLK